MPNKTFPKSRFDAGEEEVSGKTAEHFLGKVGKSLSEPAQVRAKKEDQNAKRPKVTTKEDIQQENSLNPQFARVSNQRTQGGIWRHANGNY